MAAGLDLVTAQAQVAAAQRDLVVARTNFQMAETQLKNMLSKRMDPVLDAAEIETTDPLPMPQERDVPLPRGRTAVRHDAASRPPAGGNGRAK